ncbi:bifunctional folylpolyglutamate synthase/dihydrofolate synthase [bacterium]|nr:bifunctional folylpolyglutamate synthase/dihydrofolate synthase [bacterium]
MAPTSPDPDGLPSPPEKDASPVVGFDAGAASHQGYREALEHLYGRLDLERVDPSKMKLTVERDIQRFRELLHDLGDPHLARPVIHATGTKGKGSTLAHLDAILNATGYHTGMTLSPHLVEVRERIRIGGEDLSRNDFARLYSEIRPVIEERDQIKNYRTVFEVLIALAFHAFRHYHVDAALVEIGLGGRLDATNVVYPKLSILTRIGLDHTHVLGDTHAKIAWDKAHIIKPDTPVVTGPQVPEAMREIEKRAHEVSSPIWRMGREAKLEDVSVAEEGTSFTLVTPLREWTNLRTPLLGRHQAENAAVAVLAAERLQMDRHYHFSEEKLRLGLKQVRIPGRGELLNGEPPLLLDGAHNPEGARVLAQLLRDVWPDREKVYLLGCNKDKDVAGFIGLMPGPVKAAVATTVDFPRAMPSPALAQIMRNQGWSVHEAPLDNALETARNLAGPAGLIVASGSLYLVGALRRQILQAGDGDTTLS